ncbi:MAG: hypothetical protein JWR46_1768 [Mycobacterium sp.]|nr:hypothetical protein [Mycobacterium sp.]
MLADFHPRAGDVGSGGPRTLGQRPRRTRREAGAAVSQPWRSFGWRGWSGVIFVISGSIAVAANTFHDFSDIDHLGWVMATGIIGFIGKELVATYRIRVAVRSSWRRTRHRPDDQRLGRLSFKPLPSMSTAIAKAVYESRVHDTIRIEPADRRSWRTIEGATVQGGARCDD